VVSRDEICQTCDAYLAYLSKGDVDSLVALYAPDAVVTDPLGSPPKVGHEPIREFYASTTGVDLTATRVGPVTVVGQDAAFLFRIDVVVGDDTITLHSTDLMTFNEVGQVTAMTAYPDTEAKPGS
jgi:steroid Delta-isomerase